MLYVSDLDHSINFYTTAFDLTVTNRINQISTFNNEGKETTVPVKMAFLKFPGQDFVYELAEQPTKTAEGNQVILFQHVGVDVKNIDKAYQRAVDAGAESLLAVRRVKAKGVEAKQAFLKGPDGERIELMEIFSGSF